MQTRLQIIDWLVIGLYALGMLVVGWYYARKTKSSEDYHLGGKVMKSWTVGLSLFASLLSTISYLALPGEVIKHGPMVISQIIAYPLIAWIVGWKLIPHLMSMNITSAYEILENKLGLGIRLLGASIFILLRLLWMSLVIYATCEKILIPILQIDSSYTPLLCIFIAGITIMYTSMGGLRAVVFTDVIQTFILFGGAVLTLILITIKLGGVSQWWPTQWNPHWQKIVIFDFNSRISLFGMFITTVCWHVFTCGSDQIAIQRYLATPSPRAARKAFIINLIAGAIVTIFLAFLGLALLAFFEKKTGNIVGDSDQFFTKFITNELPIGICGLIIAGLFAAAMSSLSSGVNSACSVIATDFIERFYSTPIKEKTRVWLDRLVSVAIGIVVILLSLSIRVVPGNLFEMAYRVANLFVAPLFVLFFLAMFVKRANPLGAWFATGASMATAISIGFWESFTGLPGISFLWLTPLSFCVGVVVGFVVSIILNVDEFDLGAR